MTTLRSLAYTTTVAVSLTAGSAIADSVALDMKFAGALEFAEDGTLFVGDNFNGSIYAFEVPATATNTDAIPVSIGDIDTKIANMLGVKSGAIEINDMVVHPGTNEIYISLTRIGGFASQPAIVKVTQAGEIKLLDLASLSFKKQDLDHYPDQETTFAARGLMGAPASPRDLAKGEVKLTSMAIMDMEYHNGELFVSGVAHDNFLSSLRRIAYPFDGSQSVTSVDMYHIAHDQFETRAPVRAMTIREIDGEEQLIAAYTCSPIVLIPLDELVDGAKITANTIADMGNGQPLDMIPYMQDGQEMLFVTNNSRSPQVIPVGGLNGAKAVGPDDFERGPKLDLHPDLPYGPLGEMVMFEGVSLQMDLLGENYFVSLTRDAYTGDLNLDTNPTFFPNRVHNLEAEFDFPQWQAAHAGATSE